MKPLTQMELDHIIAPRPEDESVCRYCGRPIDRCRPMKMWLHKGGKFFCNSLGPDNSCATPPPDGVLVVMNESDENYL